MARTLLNAAVATGAGSSFYTGSIPAMHTVQATMGILSGGTLATAVTVDLEGSLDDTFWQALDSHTFTAGEITAEGAIWHIVNAPARYVRANITTLTDTATDPTVTVKYVQARRT